MPTMDLDASVRAVCAKDPRFRPEAYHFLLEALDFTLKRRGMAGPGPGPSGAGAASPTAPGDRTPSAPVPWNVTGTDLLEGFRDLALDRFGALAREVLHFWGITRTDDVGAVVFNMVGAGLLQKTATDSPADYHAVFDFESALDRAFADRLKAGEVRMADRRPG